VAISHHKSIIDDEELTLVELDVNMGVETYPQYFLLEEDC
jgi:hypothetical protein